MFQPEDPEFGLDQFMCLDAFGGGWVPGGIDGNPMHTAAFLEYLRRGGETFIDVPVWREYAAQHGSVRWVKQVMEIGAELERMTEASADVGAFAEYLGPMLDRI